MTAVQWREHEGTLKAFVTDDRGRERAAVWAPQPGSQEAFLSCPLFEVLYTGTRGPGKTDALIMDFGQHVGQSFGADWRGVLFRRTYPELSDVIAKSKKWFPQIWPQAKFNEQKVQWIWPEGEALLFRHMAKPEDYWSYHGHAFPWIAFEELTTWPDSKCYTVMMSCSRSTRKDMPRKYRSTTNPYGVGHNWVKARFRLPVPPGQVIGPVIEDFDERGQPLPLRVAIHGKLEENKILLASDPQYINRIVAAARNPSELAAWKDGSWDIIAGGMFDDLWRPEVHVIPDLKIDQIPGSWKVDRSYDHGQSKPFSVGWWAESNGEPIKIDGRWIGAVPKDLVRIFEWYGWRGTPNEGLRMSAADIAQGILDRERDWRLSSRVGIGIADSAIFDDYEPGKSVAGDMARVGVRWHPADKGHGSRMQGWEQLRNFLRGTYAVPGGVRESPGLFICQRCEQFRRTFPVLPRDERNMDDVDTDAEDHVADEVRYRVRAKQRSVTSQRWK